MEPSQIEALATWAIIAYIVGFFVAWIWFCVRDIIENGIPEIAAPLGFVVGLLWPFALVCLIVWKISEGIAFAIEKWR